MTDAADRAALLHDVPVSRRDVLLGTLAGGFALAVQPVAASTITTPADGLVAGMVEIPAADRAIPAYRALPAAGERVPVVLVVQEIFGLHEYIRDVCRRFARAGYCAIAPDMYVRQGDVTQLPDIPAIQTQVVSKVPDAQVMSDLDAALAWAAKQPRIDAARAYVTGFCWGGRITWLYAAHNPRLRGGVAWYGRVVGETNELRPGQPVDVAGGISVPVLGLYGGKDAGIPLDGVEKLRATLAAGKSGSEIVVYPEGPHGFHADYRPTYRAEMAQDAWARTLAWFEKHR